MAAPRADVTKVALPPGVRAGTVVGRGGHNVKWLHFHSGGAHITVYDTGVVIRAKEPQVRTRALHLVRRQLEAAARQACQGDLLPNRLDFLLLESAFGVDPRVTFAPRTDETAAATGHKDKLFQLVPAPPGASPCGERDEAATRRTSGGGCGAESPEGAASQATSQSSSRAGSPHKRDQDSERDQDAGSECSRRRSEGGEGSVRYLAARSEPPAAAGSPSDTGAATTGDTRMLLQLQPAGVALAEAAQAAGSQTLRVDGLRVRFKLGKALFRNVGLRAGRSLLSSWELEDLGSGRGGPQSTFSGLVPPSVVPRVTSWLTEQLGFSLVQVKTSATLHVINQELNLHYTVALAMERHGDDSTAVLRKVKAGSPRCHSVVLLGGPQDLDLRLKMMAQHKQMPGLVDDADAQSAARRIVSGVRAEGFQGFVRSKRGLPRNWHLEYARRKSKHVYEGSIQTEDGGTQRMRLSVMEVTDTLGTHHEVSGCLPDLDNQLQGLIATPPPPPPPPPRPRATIPSDSLPAVSAALRPLRNFAPIEGPDSVNRRTSSSCGGASGGGSSVTPCVPAGPHQQVACRVQEVQKNTLWSNRALYSLAVFVTGLNSQIQTQN